MSITITGTNPSHFRDLIVKLLEDSYEGGFNHGSFVQATYRIETMTRGEAQEIIAKRAEFLAELVNDLIETLK